jgi:hypothetical protein
MTDRLGILFLAAAIATAAYAQTNGVVVRNLATPGALAVENHGSEISLSREVLVERKLDGAWIKANVLFELAEKCGAGEEPPACVDLSAKGSLTPVPWNGYTCSGQCPRSCRSNHYAPPGEFRFVVQTCDRKQRYRGEAFVMPPEKRP